MTIKELENHSKEELIQLVQNLKRQKRFGLVWEEKPEEIVTLCQSELPVLEEVENRAITASNEGATSFIIEGDNYHALSVLNYTHAGKVDVIYIDPPYNTGNKSWRYNNNFIEKDDTFKHSKWLSFMHSRLKLTKDLLTDDGVLILTIDDYEVFHIGLLLDEIFGEENRLGVVTIQHNPRGRSDDKYFATSHEYALFYAKNAATVKTFKLDLTEDQAEAFKLEDESSFYRLLPFQRSGSNSRKHERPKLNYPIYYSPSSKTLSLEEDEEHSQAIYPVDAQGIERVWRWGKESTINVLNTDLIAKESAGQIKLFLKDRIKEGRKPKTVWTDAKYDASSHGTMLLERILQKNKSFDYPKSLYAVLDCLTLITKNKKNALILDYFAGSGTTAHAVLELNKSDGGNRRFILNTNNENQIAEEVTYPRVKRVVEGYAEISGIPATVRYFKTRLISRQQSDDQTRAELVERSTEMICLREDTFDKVTETRAFKVFQNKDHYSAIIFRPEAISQLKEELRKIKGSKPAHIYVFSLSNDTYESDFSDLERGHELCPIPESILEVYRRIFSDQISTKP